MVEYALIIAAVVVMSLGAIQSLQGESNDEVQNEFDCISERPPPPTCQKRAVTTTTSTTISATTSTTQPEPTTSSTESTTTTTTTTTTPDPSTSSTTTPPSPSTASWSCPSQGCARNRFGAGWEARARLDLRDANNAALDGASVTVEVVNDVTGSVIASYGCVIQATARCEDSSSRSAPWNDIPDSVGRVHFRVSSVDHTPPVAVPTQLSPDITRPGP